MPKPSPERSYDREFHHHKTEKRDVHTKRDGVLFALRGARWAVR